MNYSAQYHVFPATFQLYRGKSITIGTVYEHMHCTMYSIRVICEYVYILLVYFSLPLMRVPSQLLIGKQHIFCEALYQNNYKAVQSIKESRITQRSVYETPIPTMKPWQNVDTRNDALTNVDTHNDIFTKWKCWYTQRHFYKMLIHTTTP